MYRDFGVKNKEYTAEDVKRIAQQITKRDLTSFFSDYVDGDKIIPRQTDIR